MGWCSATSIFDAMAKYVIDSPQTDDQKIAALAKLAQTLESEDWDCQQDSSFYEHPIVKRVFRQLHPDWGSLDDPTREDRIDRVIGGLTEPARSAARLLITYGQEDGAHHKTWVIDQAVRVLLGVHYGYFVSAYEDGEDGRHTFTWDKGVAP